MTAAILAAAALACRPPSASPLPAPRPSPVEVAVTIDDLPFIGGVAAGDSPARAIDRIVAALRAAGAPATGFVACDRIGDVPILARWGSLPLGNHSSSHRPIDALEPAAWLADIRACRDRLSELGGRTPRYFRYPFLQQGRTAGRRDAARATVRELGHEPAPVSIDTSDWVLNPPYVSALRAGDRARRQAIATAYVEHLVSALRHYREVARERLGRDVKHILLIHANALAADHLGAALAAYRREGARFIALEAALSDPVYARPDDYAGPIGLSWLYRFAPARGAAWAWDRAQERELSRRFGRP